MDPSTNLAQLLPNRTILKVTGNDAERYLNGQISQDVALATENTALYSIVANFKGKLEGDLYIRRHNKDIIIDTCQAQRSSLLTRLDKYLIADDAEITDISDHYQLIHIIGQGEHNLSQPNWQINRYGITGTDYLIKSNTKIPLTSDHSKAEHLRIINKIPLWGKELDNNTLPPEANLEARAISYTKGCYTGQEVISRMKSAGKTNRHLVNITSNTETTPPTELFTDPSASGKPAAHITSQSKINNKWISLGYRTRKAQAVNLLFDKHGNKFTIT